MNRRRLKYLLILGVFGIAVAAQLIYRQMTTRSTIRLAFDPEGGQHHDVMTTLQNEIGYHSNFKTIPEDSAGSLENLILLQQGKVDFALYQSGVQQMQSEETSNSGTDTAARYDKVRFVCNLYSDPVHWIVRKHAGIETFADLKGKLIAVGEEDSGDSAISKVLLEQFGIDDHKPCRFEYEEIPGKFESDELDAAFIAVGTRADVFQRLSENGNVEIRSLENIPALVESQISLSPCTIPKGLYQATGNVSPAADIETVCVKTQLLCRKDLPASVVEEVMGIVLSEEFMRKEQFRELFEHGHKFARERPEFALHRGASHYYDPELKPILNSDFVGAIEGLRSFIVSLLIAGYVAWRSWKRWNERLAEHRLDQYIRRLLEIERQQVTLGTGASSFQRDQDGLQRLLDAVTDLRQECLRDVTAYDLNEDRSVDCFLEMCHALSDKINATLLRVHLDERFEELATSLNENTGRETKLPAGE